jgi:hypothetical protein
MKASLPFSSIGIQGRNFLGQYLIDRLRITIVRVMVIAHALKTSFEQHPSSCNKTGKSLKCLRVQFSAEEGGE